MGSEFRTEDGTEGGKEGRSVLKAQLVGWLAGRVGDISLTFLTQLLRRAGALKAKATKNGG